MKVFQYIVFFQIFSSVCSWTPIGYIYNLKSVSRVRIADKDHVVWKSKETEGNDGNCEKSKEMQGH